MNNLKNRVKGISLGMFAADAGNLRAAAQSATGWGCDILHFDIMDGVFVPAMIGGPAFVKALNTGALRDVHLMVKNPADHVASYVNAGADIITVHAESSASAQAIANIRTAADDAGRAVIAGLALMPDTPLDQIKGLLALNPEMILVLSLDPRTKNPPDIAKACARITELRTLAPEALLAFDGGVTLDSITEIRACNPDMIVSGSAVLGAQNPELAFEKMAKS